MSGWNAMSPEGKDTILAVVRNEAEQFLALVDSDDAWTAPTRQGPAVFTRESQLHGITRETGALLWYQLTHSSADFEYTAAQ